MKKLLWVVLLLGANGVVAQAWRDCIPGSIGPGGCDSIGPGGGLSIGPGGGQSIGPGGGQSIGPGGGQSLLRDRSKGLNPDTLRPYDEDDED